MTRYVLRRVLQLALGVFAASVAVFVLTHLVADPARAVYPVGTSESVLDAYREREGLFDPLPTQLARHLGSTVTGDFGESIWVGGDALEVALDRVPATLLLVVPATAIGVLGGFVLGSLGARKPNGRLSRSLEVVANIAQSLAEYWVGILLVLVFAVQLGWMPAGGYDPKPRSVILPILALALNPFGQALQLARATMLAEAREQYVMTAWAKGLNAKQVTRDHVQRNAMLPIATFGFYTVSRLFVGSAVTIEVIFGWPGIGRLAVLSLQHSDVNVLGAIVVIGAVFTAVSFLVADLLAFGLDPRTRHLIKEAKY